MKRKPIVIAIPNKGVLAAPAQKLVETIGFKRNTERVYFLRALNNNYFFLLARAWDIPLLVASGVADLGITGHDIVVEQTAKVTELLSLPFGSCRLIYAESPRKRKVFKVATTFPRATQKFLKKTGRKAKIIVLHGAVESSIAAGVADAIVEITATGRTLKANGLREMDEILRSTAVIIANKNSLKSKKNAIKKTVSILEKASHEYYS